MSVHICFLFLSICRRHETLTQLHQPSQVCCNEPHCFPGANISSLRKVVLPGSWNHLRESEVAPLFNNALCSGFINLLPPDDQFSAPRD